jgi:hypothetical protein
MLSYFRKRVQYGNIFVAELTTNRVQKCAALSFLTYMATSKLSKA